MLRRRDGDDDRGAGRTSQLEVTDSLGAEMTVVGRGAQFEGTLVSDESIRIDGQAKGRIAAGGDVILSSQSDVEADIHGRNVVMGGKLRGTITARTKTELAEGGHLEGWVRCKVLVVHEGAVFAGQSNVDPNVAAEAAHASGPTDELQTAYQEATLRAADWYRSRLAGQKRESDRGRTGEHETVETPKRAPATGLPSTAQA